MDTVGTIIKKRRLQLNFSISDICVKLKISSEIVNKIENDEVKNSPDLVFVIGHLRSYCELLELHTDDIVNQFKNQINFKKEVYKQNITKPNLDSKIFGFQNVFSFSVIFFILTTFTYFFINNNKNEREYALVPDIPESAIPIIEKSNIDIISNKENKKDTDEFENIISFNKTSVVASTNIEKIKNYEESTITLKFLDSTWFQIRDNTNNIIISKLMKKNDEYTYDSNLNYSITAGNAGNILVIIDQNVRGKIGKYGEIIDSYVLDKNFTN